jgi:hypothetical protein
LLSSGDLLELYPSLSGEWGKDKDRFLRDYDLNNRLMRGEEDIFEDPFGDNEFNY